MKTSKFRTEDSNLTILTDGTPRCAEMYGYIISLHRKESTTFTGGTLQNNNYNIYLTLMSSSGLHRESNPAVLTDSCHYADDKNLIKR